MGGNEAACRVTEEKNPCWKESKISMKCLDNNAYDKSKCEAEFENYKQCKTFWMKVKFARRREGLFPLQPDTEEERIAFRKKYRETGEIPASV
jgi:cytochrome c oxidase assembly protein subunit 23